MSYSKFNPQLISYFYDNSINDGVVEHGIFSDNSINNGIVLGEASFANNSENNGIVYGDVYALTTAVIHASSVGGTIHVAGLPLCGSTTCNHNNGMSLVLYMHHEDILTHGTILYKYPNFFEAFSGEFYMDLVKYTIHPIAGVTGIESCDPYAN